VKPTNAAELDSLLRADAYNKHISP
jgi:hypothetical protein